MLSVLVQCLRGRRKVKQRRHQEVETSATTATNIKVLVRRVCEELQELQSLVCHRTEFKSELKRKLFEILEKEDDYIRVSDITGQFSKS